MLAQGQLTTTSSAIIQATDSTNIKITTVVFKNLSDTTKNINLYYVPHNGTNGLGNPTNSNIIIEKTLNPRETYQYTILRSYIVLNDQGDALFADANEDNKVNYFVLNNQ